MQMKLLNLQTGKYLELDKDFWFGGNVIILLENLKRSANTYSLLDEVNACARFTKQPHANPIVNKIAEKVGAVIYGGRYVLIYGKIGNIVEQYRFHVTGCRNLNEYSLLYIKDTIMHTTPESDLMKDIFISTKTVKRYELDKEYDYRKEDRHVDDKRWYNSLGERSIDDFDINDEVKEVIIGNIFEEYSKQLRNEPNKFEESKELIK